MRTMHRALSALALGALAGWASAGEIPLHGLTDGSARLQQQNQKTADDLAAMVRSSGGLEGYAVDIEVDGGVVTLSGTVADGEQRAALFNLVRRHPGVVSVLDQVQVQAPATLVVANYQPAAPAAPGKLPPKPAAGDHPANGQVLEPAPIREFPGGVAPYSDAPVMPPYAWPAYTPYNNYASMAYQTQYPAGAWPFIGPPYPYPMIPSGWRRVTLKWQKGYWWLKFHAM